MTFPPAARSRRRRKSARSREIPAGARVFIFALPLRGFFLEAGRNFGETFFPVPDFFFKTKNYGKPIRTE